MRNPNFAHMGDTLVIAHPEFKPHSIRYKDGVWEIKIIQPPVYRPGTVLIAEWRDDEEPRST